MTTNYELMVDTAAGITGTNYPMLFKGIGADVSIYGRYLGTGGAGVTPITDTELSYIGKVNGKVLPIYNDSTAANRDSGISGGKADATLAVSQARAVGIEHCAIVCDLEEGWNPSPEWWNGWIDTLIENGYTPGVYGSSWILIALQRLNWRDITPNIGRTILWQARWLTMPGNRIFSVQDLPRWNVTPATKVRATIAWQFASCGEFDESLFDTSFTDLLYSPSGDTAPNVSELETRIHEAEKILEGE